MPQIEQDFGKVNPNAPAALSRFAFLIGSWRCDARVKSPSREWQTLQGTWLGRFILDGYAIADEYRMTGPSGELIVLGLSLRAYDAATQTWNIKWLNALAGTWTDLGPEELGGVTIDGQSISYAFREPVAAPRADPRHLHEHFRAALHVAGREFRRREGVERIHGRGGLPPGLARLLTPAPDTPCRAARSGTGRSSLRGPCS